MFDIGLGHYLTLSAIIFTIGVVGIFLNRKNIIRKKPEISAINIGYLIRYVAF